MLMDINKLGGRKFILAIISIIAAVAVEALTKDGISTQLVSFFAVIMGSFSVANVMGKGKTISNITPIPLQEKEEVLETVEPVEQYVPAITPDAVPQAVEQVQEALHLAGLELQELKQMQVQTAEGVTNILAILNHLMQPQK